MKKILILTFACFLAVLAQAQMAINSTAASAPVSSQPPAGKVVGYQVSERGANYRNWQKIIQTTDAQGNIILQTNSAYVELASGLNYWAGNQWNESKEEIDGYAGGAIAQYGQHKVIFANNLNTAGAIDLQTPDGKELKSHILGLSYLDTASGKSVMIAQVKDCQGQIVSSNQVIYANAFDGIGADVRYTYRRGSFEQDVILEESPPTPEAFGLNSASTVLQVLTEFDSTPTPNITIATNQIPSADEMADQFLDFGAMKMVPGKAFAVGQNPLDGIRVSKQWTTVDGRTILVEEVKMSAILNQLNQLPRPLATTMKPAKNSILDIVSAKRLLPSPKLAATTKKKMKLAKLTPKQGLVLDYMTVNGSVGDYTFQGDTTYYVSGMFEVSGVTTIEGGTVIKIAGGIGPQIIIGESGTVVCKTDAYRPGIFTSVNDNSVGATITGSDGSPQPYDVQFPLFLYATSLALHDLRFNYYDLAIEEDDYDSSLVNVTNCQFLNGDVAVASYHIGLFNTLISKNFSGADDSDAAIYLYGPSLICENVTADGGPAFVEVDDSEATIAVTNCIIANVSQFANPNPNPSGITGGNNGFYNNTAFGADPVTTSSNPFQTAGGGNYYLANDYPFRNAGTLNIDPLLLSALHQRTTYPPDNTSYANVTLSSEVDLYPRGLADADIPDLGYHYPVLDYIIQNVNLSASLYLHYGVAIGIEGSEGLIPQNDGQVFSTGYPYLMNQIVSCQNVQEQTPAGGSVFILFNTGTDASRQLQFQFTDFSMGQGGTGNILLSGSGIPPFQNILFQNCWLRGAFNANLAPGGAETISLINNLIFRSMFQISSYYEYNYSHYPVAFNCYNNLFRGGELEISYEVNVPGQTTWPVKDNLFDGAAQYLDNGGPTALSNNGFTSGTVNSLGGSGNQTGLTADYQAGPLGDFYYPNSGSGDLFALVDHGSRSADDAGLSYYFTTQQNQTPDTGTVDIGYHYSILSAPIACTTDQQICPNNFFGLCGEDYNGFGWPVSYIVVLQPTHGTLGYDAYGNFGYTPNSCYEGEDTFTYKVYNGYLYSDPDTVTVTVADAVHAYYNPTPAQTCKNTLLNISLGGNDDCGLTVNTPVVLTPPAHGMLSGTSPNVTYTPSDPNFTGTDSFTFQVNNSCGNSDVGTVNITVGDANLCPQSQTAMTGVNQAINLTLTAQDNDQCEDNPLTYTITSGPQVSGSTVTPGSGTGAVQYTPKTGYEGPDTFNFTVSDGTWNSQCSDGQVTIFVVGGPTLTAQCNPTGPGILLNWSLDSIVQLMEDENTDGFGILDFKIYRATSSGGPYGDPIATVNASQNSYLDMTVLPGTTYYYVVTFEYQDSNTGTIYPAFVPVPGKAPYSTEAQIMACQPPSSGTNGMDVVFIIDNTGSMDDVISAIQDAIDNTLDYIVASSGGNYRLALVTPDNDQVNVRVNFASNNRSAFEDAVNALPDLGDPYGNNTPESTDKCLETVVRALAVSQAVNDYDCIRPSPPPDGPDPATLQIGDFTPAFHSNAKKLVVLITDAPPSGFCDADQDQYDNPSYDPMYASYAHQRALEAATNNVHINAIQISTDSYATPIMQDYSTTSCGWYSQLDYYSSDSDVETAILNMLYAPDACQ
ncbi:MAG TPA: Ig-like domain-containing protein [Verrucomicrobiae bacterium]|jgi:hypothetical protein